MTAQTQGSTGGTGTTGRAAGAKTRTIPDTVNELTAARKMSELIVALEALRRQSRDAHDAAEVAAEALMQKCRDAGTWPKGWDKIPEARRWRKLAMEAAADYADAADAWDALVTRATRVMEDLNSKRKGREKFNAAE